VKLLLLRTHKLSASGHRTLVVCAGGELFDAIMRRGEFTEYDAASIMRPILSVVEHCHNMGVMHRDIKPENFLLANRKPSAPIKLTDFGVSCFFKVCLCVCGGVGGGSKAQHLSLPSWVGMKLPVLSPCQLTHIQVCRQSVPASLRCGAACAGGPDA
jgi:serine/threonine protein kinase